MGKSKRNTQDCNLDMTPMIDVVFQLIIFFIVTITMSEAKDDDVRLELGPHGQEIESNNNDTSTRAMVIDVNRKGRISMSNVTLSQDMLNRHIQTRINKMGTNFQIWIRGDARASHDMIRKVMDTCTAAGVAKVSFIAVKDPRTPETKKFLQTRPRRR